MERQHILAILKKTHGVIEGPAGAARLLNLKPSTTRFRIKKLASNGNSSRTDCCAGAPAPRTPQHPLRQTTTPGG